MKKGKLNRITDVEGVMVGHKTICSGTHQTGVTFIRTAEDVFHQKLACGCSILNGFGKTTGTNYGVGNTRKLYLFDKHFKCGGCSTSLGGYHG